MWAVMVLGGRAPWCKGQRQAVFWASFAVAFGRSHALAPLSSGARCHTEAADAVRCPAPLSAECGLFPALQALFNLATFPALAEDAKSAV